MESMTREAFVQWLQEWCLKENRIERVSDPQSFEKQQLDVLGIAGDDGGDLLNEINAHFNTDLTYDDAIYFFGPEFSGIGPGYFIWAKWRQWKGLTLPGPDNMLVSDFVDTIFAKIIGSCDCDSD